MSETRQQHHVRFYFKGAWVMVRVTVNPKDFNQSQAVITYNDSDDGWVTIDPKDVTSFGTLVYINDIDPGSRSK